MYNNTKIKEKKTVLLAHVSVRTVQCYLHDDLKFLHHTTRKELIITLSQRKTKLFFANNICSGLRSANECCDCCIQCYQEPKWKMYWRPRRDLLDIKFTQGTFTYPDKLIEQGTIGYRGVGKLIILLGNVARNADRYLELVSDHSKAYFEMHQTDLFMQDSSPCHIC